MRGAQLTLATLCYLISALVSVPHSATPEHPDEAVLQSCALIGNKLYSVSVAECLSLGLADSGGRTERNLPILFKEYPPLPQRTPKARILLIGGIHGNEYSSFSVLFKWMATLNKYHSGLFHWYVAPAINLDGLLMSPATRTNANGVDLNRNMDYGDSDITALDYWQTHAKRNPNRYPGEHALSESETRWVQSVITQFRPDIILSLHAPYGMVDYDGPEHIQPPASLGPLKLDELDTPPGSMGFYVGRRTPLLTIEFASATSMPANEDIRRMWVDLIRWLSRVTPVPAAPDDQSAQRPS